jgi:hypothetical protein
MHFATPTIRSHKPAALRLRSYAFRVFLGNPGDAPPIPVRGERS